MTGATDGGITFSASVDAEAGTEVDTGDFELDGAASGAFGLGAVSMTGAFGTITFDDNGIDNLYDDDLVPAHDVKYATTVGGVSLTARTETDKKTSAGGDGAENELALSYTTGALTVSYSKDTGNVNQFGDEAETVTSITYTVGGMTLQAKGTDRDETEVSAAFSF